jgi:site-specific recombinase XerD
MSSQRYSRHREIISTGTPELITQTPLDELISSWDTYLQTEMSPSTRSAYLKGMRVFSEWLQGGGLTIASARPSHIRNWREQFSKIYAVQTVNLWLSAIRRFYAFLIEEFDAPILNPAAQVRGVSRRGVSRRHKRDELTPSEVRSVLNTCDTSKQGRRDKAILALMAYCALRTSEVRLADLADLQTRDGRIILWVKGKGYKEPNDFVVLPKPAVKAINSWLKVRGKKKGSLFWSLSRQNREERLSARGIRGMVKKRYMEAGVVGLNKSTHSLRHSAISTAIRNGAEPLQVQAMARHKNYNTTLIYYHELSRTENPAEDLITY